MNEFVLERDPVRDYVRDLGSLYRLADHARRNEALSYRKFHVGSSGKLHLPSLDQTIDISAANYKITPEDDKFCAEMGMIEQAERLGTKANVIGAVIVGTDDPDEIEEVSGFPTDTLHPCSDCRDGMLRRKKLFSADTLIMTSGPNLQAVQLHYFGELQQLYSEKSDSSVFIFERSHSLHWGDFDEMLDKYDELVSEQPSRVARPLLAKLAIESSFKIDGD